MSLSRKKCVKSPEPKPLWTLLAHALTILNNKEQCVMFKSSFTVRYKLPREFETVTVLGVTSIVPNLNGILLYTEDGRHHQIENHEMTVPSRYHKEYGDTSWVNMKIEYSKENQIKHYKEQGFTSCGKYICLDHRK